LSLIDGKPYKALKRHLRNHGLTPAEYRERFGLKADYPMVAPGYAEKRRDLAKAIGLGRKKTEVPKEQEQGQEQPQKPARRARPKKTPAA